MKMHFRNDQIELWVEDTISLIMQELDRWNIPFTDNRNTKNDLPHRFYTHQLLFPWHDGDVVVGTLHVLDDDVINGVADIHYPSIETYNFPWDDGDITVFEDPLEFVEKVKTLYRSLTGDISIPITGRYAWRDGR